MTISRDTSLQTRPVSVLPVGTALARYAMALAKAHGQPNVALNLADEMRDTPQVSVALRHKAIRPPYSTADSALVPSGIAAEVETLLKPVSAFAQAEPRMRKVPFFARVPRAANSGSGGDWVAENKPTPVIKSFFDVVFLEPAKVGDRRDDAGAARARGSRLGASDAGRPRE